MSTYNFNIASSSTDATFAMGGNYDGVYLGYLTESDLEFYRDGDTLVIHDIVGGTIRITNWQETSTLSLRFMNNKSYKESNYTIVNAPSTGIVTKSSTCYVGTEQAANLLVIAASNSMAVGGQADDMLTMIAASSPIIKGGAGNDVLRNFSGTSAVLEGQDGDDVLVLYKSSNDTTTDTLDGGAGDDTYKIMTELQANQNITIRQNDAVVGDNDCLILAKMSQDDIASETFSSNKYILTFTSGAKINVTDEVTRPLSKIVYRDGVEKLVTVTGSEDYIGTTTKALVTVNGEDGDYVSDISKGTITTGARNDQVTVSGGGFYRITTGAGNDKVTIEKGSHLVYTGDGNDVIDVTSWKANYVDAGAGDDTLTLTGYHNYNKLFGGAGNDTFNMNFTSTSYYDLAEGGTGNDTYNIKSTSCSVVIDNSSHGANDVDVINIDASFTSLASNYYSYYDSSRDIYSIRKMGIIGLKSISAINLTDCTVTPSQIIGLAQSYDFSSSVTELQQYNAGLQSVISGGFTSNAAIAAGYKGL